MEHFIHYLKREIVISSCDNPEENFAKTDSKSIHGKNQLLEDGFFKPEFHSTFQKTGHVKDIKPGSIIWLFSILDSPWGKLPPSLDAKIIVSRIENMPEGTTRFYATDDSRWYPLCDATSILTLLESTSTDSDKKMIWPNSSKPLGIYLQSIRKVNSGHLLEAWSHKVENDELNFISYRIKDGTIPAFFWAAYLMEAGKTIYWDRYCLPRRLVERRETVSGRALNAALIQQIENCNKVWGIISDLYNEPGCYAKIEANKAESLGKFCKVFFSFPAKSKKPVFDFNC